MSIEVKKISEKEYLVGGNLTKLIEGNIISVVVKGLQNKELAIKQEDVLNKLKVYAELPVNYLINLNNCGRNLPEARAKWTELMEHKETNRVAVFGVHPVAKVIASFVLGVTRRDNHKFFKSEDEALAWLNEKQS